MKPLFILPFKKNSSRLPNKNFLDLCGKPLYQWSLEQTQEASKQYPGSKIIVATDALEEVLISSFKHTYDNNVELVKLPEWLAQEPYQLASATLFVINDLFNRDVKADFDYLVMVQVTNPLILAEDIINCIELYKNNKRSIRSFTEVDRIWIQSKTISGFYCRPYSNNKPFDFLIQSCIGVLVEDINNLRNQTVRFAAFDCYPRSYMLPKERAVDIDNEMDFEYAKILLKRREKL